MSLNYMGNSYSTRFLFSICTKRLYAKKKRGFILDGIFEHLAEELRDLFYNGVTLKLNGGEDKTFFLALIGIKGDWPIQARMGNLQRHFCRKGVYKVSEKSGFCHLCRAGEEGYNPNDYSERAAWRSTFLKFPPWSSEGPFCRVPQSSAKEFMHKFDLFHTLHKGCFAELAGSPGDIPVQLTAIYEMASEYCKSQNIPLHMDALTRHLLKFSGDAENWFKGADTTAMCCFLENFWSNHISSLDAPDAYLSSMLDALRSANAFMRLLFRSGLWLSLDRCRAVAKAGLGFLKAYLEASHAAYTMRRTRFKVTPKFHAMIHIVDTLVCASNAKRQWTLSPLSESTQIDEDFVGRIASITTSVDSRVVHKQTLDRYKTNVWKHLTGRSEKE
ncbi:unnamed protein product [Symbiodinium sp. CCMP2592]|nr:unnamed protein product [Symbiodinium sp. CCMP2592]